MNDAQASPLQVGTVLQSGRYTLQRPLGSGGMASVWLAEDAQLDRNVAVKLMADTLLADRDWVRRFEREARAAGAINHPHVVRIFDFGRQGERPFLVMEYVAGGTLAARLKNGARFDVKALARELLDALDHIHGAGLVHRDIKPSNVLIGADGTARITDFGIARPDDATQLTSTGMVIGTAGYLAPEVMAGGPATPRSDLYACGILLRETAAGEPSAAADLIEDLTAAEADERPASARDALEQLGRVKPSASHSTSAATTEFMTGRTAPTRKVPPRFAPGERALPAVLRRGISIAGARPLRTVVASVLTLVVIVVLFGLIMSGGSPGQRQKPPALAPPRADLSQQLQALERRIHYAETEH
jgi:serine/threonine protein kinase